MACNEKTGRTAQETNRLNQIVANLSELTQSIDIRTDQPIIALTEQELRYLELYGMLPKSNSLEPLQKAS